MFGDILRLKWLGFGAIYGITTAMASIILTAILIPFLPTDISNTITEYDPVTSIFGNVANELILAFAGLCIVAIIALSAIIGMITWYLNSWALTVSMYTPLRFVLKGLNPYLLMIYAGMVIPVVLLIATVVLMFTGGITATVSIVELIIQLVLNVAWISVIVFLVAIGYKMLGWKLPTANRKETIG